MSRFVGDMTWPRFLLGSLAVYAVMFSVAIGLTVWLDLDGPGAFTGTCGVLYLVAASRRPRGIYLIVRNMGWFAWIKSDRAMRLLLLVLGLAMLAVTPLFLHLPRAAG